MKKLLVIATGVAVALAGVLALRSTAAAGNERWHLAERDSALEFHGKVVPISSDNVWAFGTRSFWEWSLGTTAIHWNGKRWDNVEVPGGFGSRVNAAAASSPTNLWLAAHNGTRQIISRWTGTGWATMKTMEDSVVEEIEALSEQDVWLFGEHTWHYTASGWAGADLPMYVRRASARTPGDVWAIGWKDDKPAAAHYDGTHWEIVSIEPRGGLLFPDGIVADASGVWITATVSDDTTHTSKPMLLRRTDKGWEDVPVDKVVGPWRETADPIPDGRGGHWFLGSTDVNSYDSALAHRSAEGVWTQTPVSDAPGTAEFSILAGLPGGKELFGTGSMDGVPGIYRHRLP